MESDGKIMMDESPSKLNIIPQLPALLSFANGSLKRPAPSLLPAFEPLSSSPGSFARPTKRFCSHTETVEHGSYKGYTMVGLPSPMPTSTTGIMSSSPPRIQGRPFLERNDSHQSERAPLASVPTVQLPEDGSVFKMGRSRISSDYQLSAHKLISRVHVTARYIAASAPGQVDKVEITCMGWNGMKVHCHGRSWDLAKGDSFTSETESADIMLDVQDARVFIAWPDRDDPRADSEESWDGDEKSPVKAVNLTVKGMGIMLPSSPARFERKLASPESPTPAGPAKGRDLANLFSSSPVKPQTADAAITVFEDMDSDNEPSIVKKGDTAPFADLSASQSSELSEGEVSDDPDEENDPIVHSFGPFGANLNDSMAEMGRSQAFAKRDCTPVPEESCGGSSEQSSAPPSPTPAKKEVVKQPPKPYVNHAINQLAFSRLSSTPLSVILSNLPSDLRGNINGQKGISKSELHIALLDAECVGEIHREGKDAAGQPLESEYYYIPDKDKDEQRRATVVDGLRKPSLRNCRKSHKQYYWKKPRTP